MSPRCSHLGTRSMMRLRSTLGAWISGTEERAFAEGENALQNKDEARPTLWRYGYAGSEAVPQKEIYLRLHGSDLLTLKNTVYLSKFQTPTLTIHYQYRDPIPIVLILPRNVRCSDLPKPHSFKPQKQPQILTRRPRRSGVLLEHFPFHALCASLIHQNSRVLSASDF